MKTKKFCEVWEELSESVGTERKGTFKYPKQTTEDYASSLKNQIPKGYGVYSINGISENKVSILYIGMSGTISPFQKMTKRNNLQRRLTEGVEISPSKKNDHQRVLRKEFAQELVGKSDRYKTVIDKEYPRLNGERFDAIEVRWIETFKNFTGVPPSVAEAMLLWAYLEEFGDLPILNGKL